MRFTITMSQTCETEIDRLDVSRTFEASCLKKSIAALTNIHVSHANLPDFFRKTMNLFYSVNQLILFIISWCIISSRHHFILINFIVLAADTASLYNKDKSLKSDDTGLEDNLIPGICWNFSVGNLRQREFTSPNYRKQYPNKTDCVHVITGMVYIFIINLLIERENKSKFADE